MPDKSASTVAPEVCSCKNYGLKADVYSFGIMFWEVFSGNDAYSNMSLDKHFDQVVIQGKRPSTKVAASNCACLSQSLFHSIPDMWHANPSQRPTFRNICNRLAGDCRRSSTKPSRAMDGIQLGDRQWDLSDRTRFLINRSMHSRLASGVGN